MMENSASPSVARPTTPCLGPRPHIYPAVFHAAWLLLLLSAAWWRFSFPLTPIIDSDFWGYLNPALRALNGHSLEHSHGREILYPSILYVLLASFRDFRAITIFQHTLGLATGLLLLATWCTARRALRPAATPRWLYDLAGLAMCAVFLFTPQPLQFELLIRPDAICPFFAALYFFLLVRFLLAHFVEKNSRAAFGFAVTAVFVSFVLPSLKPSFWLSTALTTTPVWFALLDRREKAGRRLLMAALPLTAAGLLLILPERLAARRDSTSAAFLPESLFSIHAPMIRQQLAADIASPDTAVPYPVEKLRSTLALLDAGMTAARLNSPHHMASLGYDADYLLYRDPFFAKMAEADGPAIESSLHFYRYYYARTWTHQPGAMLHKIGTQLALFYGSNCPAYSDRTYEMKKFYAHADDLLQGPNERAIIEAWPPARAYHAAVVELKEHETSIPTRTASHRLVYEILRSVTRGLARCYLPLLLAWLATLPWVCWRAESRARFGIFAAILAGGYAFNFGNNFAIAIAHTLEISRYNTVQFATTLLTQMLTGAYLLEFLAAHILKISAHAARVGPDHRRAAQENACAVRCLRAEVRPSCAL